MPLSSLVSSQEKSEYAEKDDALRSGHLLSKSDILSEKTLLGSLFDEVITNPNFEYRKQIVFEDGIFKNEYFAQTEFGNKLFFTQEQLDLAMAAKEKFDVLFYGKDIEFQKVVYGSIKLLGQTYKAKIKIDIFCEGVAYDLKALTLKFRKDGSPAPPSLNYHAQQTFYSIVGQVPTKLLVYNLILNEFYFVDVDYVKGLKKIQEKALSVLLEIEKYKAQTPHK